MVGDATGRCLRADIGFGRDEDDEDEGRELETTGEWMIGDVVIGRQDDDPASNN
jgi:hypothetical protein